MSKLNEELKINLNNALDYIEESANRNVIISDANKMRLVAAMTNEPHMVKAIEHSITIKRREDWFKIVLDRMQSTRSYADRQNFAIDIAQHLVRQQLDGKKFPRNLRSIAECYALLADLELETRAVKLIEKSVKAIQRRVIGSIQHMFFLHKFHNDVDNVEHAFDRILKLYKYFYVVNNKNNDEIYNEAIKALTHNSKNNNNDYFAHDMMLLFFQHGQIIFGNDWIDGEEYTGESLLNEPLLRKIVDKYYPIALTKEIQAIINECKSLTHYEISLNYNEAGSERCDDYMIINFINKENIKIPATSFSNINDLRKTVLEKIEDKLAKLL